MQLNFYLMELQSMNSNTGFTLILMQLMAGKLANSSWVWTSMSGNKIENRTIQFLASNRHSLIILSEKRFDDVAFLWFQRHLVFSHRS